MASVLDVVEIIHPDPGVSIIIRAFLIDAFRSNEVPLQPFCAQKTEKAFCVSTLRRLRFHQTDECGKDIDTVDVQMLPCQCGGRFSLNMFSCAIFGVPSAIVATKCFIHRLKAIFKIAKR